MVRKCAKALEIEGWVEESLPLRPSVCSEEQTNTSPSQWAEPWWQNPGEGRASPAVKKWGLLSKWAVKTIEENKVLLKPSQGPDGFYFHANERCGALPSRPGSSPGLDPSAAPCRARDISPTLILMITWWVNCYHHCHLGRFSALPKVTAVNCWGWDYFSRLMRRTDALEKTLMPRKIVRAGEGGNRGWDGRMAARTQWTRVWANSWRYWRTGEPSVLPSMGSERVRHDWVTDQELPLASLSSVLRTGFQTHQSQHYTLGALPKTRMTLMAQMAKPLSPAIPTTKVGALQATPAWGIIVGRYIFIHQTSVVYAYSLY